MANCLRCGKPLEKDGFCMNCMDFTREDEDIQKDKDYNGLPDQAKPYADDYASIYKNEQNHQSKINTKHNVKQDETNTISRSIMIRRILSYIVMGVGFCIIGIYMMLNLFGKSKQHNNKTDVQIYKADTDNKSVDNDETDLDDLAVTTDTEDTKDDVTVYEADYDEIMKAGEPSNAYLLFSALKNEVAPVMEQYFQEKGINTTFQSDMDNTYMIVDGERYTDYRSYSMWSYGDNQKDKYIIYYDTVTGQLLHIDIYSEKKEEAIELVKKSILAIDPGISLINLNNVCKALENSEISTDERCDEYEVYGNYDKSINMYNYIIESTVDNRK